jgi:ribonuclease J
MAKNLKVIFLGGVGEIGKNMTVLEYDNEILVVDAGLGFPGDDMPGIDLVVQDITYLERNRDKVKGYVITHGHEDHIGGLPYVLENVPGTIYASRLTLALVENKLREHPGIKAKAVSVRPRSVVQIGKHFSVEFIHVNHSVAGSFALSITTPVGIVFHTGDFKIDHTPVDGMPIDLTRIGEIGKKGVMLMLGESTNAERKGFTMSETSVGERLNEIFEDNKDRRLFVATFASHIHRVQQLLDLAEKHKRKVAFSGRSMLNVTDAAIKIGEMKARPDNIIDITHVGNYADKEILIILTGSQGEPMSALSRMAAGDFHGKIHIGPNDTVIMSASPIPGNERAVNNVVNNLIKRGAEVVYESLAEVHVSGHACEEELKIIHSLVHPHFFIPVHGEYSHMKKHIALAQKLGMNKRNILMPDVGDCVELSISGMKRAGSVPSGIKLIDGLGRGGSDSMVLRDRMTLAEEGVCVIGIGYDKSTGKIISGPDVMTKGLLYSEEMEELLTQVKSVILDCAKNLNFAKDDPGNTRAAIRKDVQMYFQKELKRRPVVITMLQGN